MARLHTSFILGYHGCSTEIGEAVLAGNGKLAQSEKDYDWLGPGTYFWEADPRRAWEWADAKVARREINQPCVVGAAIDLGNCLDMMARDSLELMATAYAGLRSAVELTENANALPRYKGSDGDRLLRFLDCAVIRYLHKVTEGDGKIGFDTVRGLFNEGEDLFPGSGFKARTHVQIAVRQPDCIKGFFRVSRPAA